MTKLSQGMSRFFYYQNSPESQKGNLRQPNEKSAGAKDSGVLNFRVCSIKGCGREIQAKRLCRNHYSQLRQYGKCCSLPSRPERRSYRKCEVVNCNREHYQYGYCRKHFENFKHCGNPLGLRYGIMHKCIVPNCCGRTLDRYCNHHLERYIKGLPLTYKSSNKGERNGNWRGGVAEYPNHYLMKKNRLIVLKRHPICQKCKVSKSTEVHHRNGNKSDHRIINLMASCHSCNGSIRFSPNNTQNYRKYRMSFYQIAEKIGYTYTRIYNWEKDGVLETLIASNPKIFRKRRPQ